MHGTRIAEDEPMAEMNFIPLIDVALTLVIILMVTTAFIRQPGVSLRLPETATREGTPETPKDLVIAVTREGALFVDGRAQTLPELRSRMDSARRLNPQTRVLIKGDRDVAHGRVMDVLDTVRQAGLVKVVFPTNPKVASTPPPPAGG